MIPPHAEMAYTPFRPDMLWFYCETPASQGGETLLCDGLDLWSRLRPATKDLFLSQKLTYRKKFSNDRTRSQFYGAAVVWAGDGRFIDRR